MAILARLLDVLGLQRRSSLTLDQLADVLAPRTHAGVAISEESAMRAAAVHACVRIISESVAQLPLILYRRTGDRRERATDSPLYALLHDSPTPAHTAYEWREYVTTCLLLYGNAYAEIERARDGTPVALWPIPPTAMDVAVEAGAIRYRVRDGKGSRELPRWAVLHIRNLSLDGVLGASPIRLAREAIGLSLATEEAAARLWGSGGVPREAIRIPGITQPEQWEQWRAVVERVRGGLEGSHRVQVLPAEWQLDRIGIPPADAEYIETRRFQILDIARIYRVPPHMLGLLEKSSYASIEQQAIEFVQHALLPWLRRIEQAIRRDVIPPWEPDLYAEHLVDGLLRGDIESRYRAYAIARQWGWMSANEIRARENMEPIPGGDRYLEPLNMAAIASTGGQGGQ